MFVIFYGVHGEDMWWTPPSRMTVIYQDWTVVDSVGKYLTTCSLFEINTEGENKEGGVS